MEHLKSTNFENWTANLHQPTTNPATIGANDLPHWQRSLGERGILTSALNAGWRGAHREWIYPIRDLYGDILTHRSKAYDSHAKPKYRWMPAKPVGCDYYYPPADIRQAIAADDGRIYIAAGEVDVLTYAAAGINNVLAWFGETSIPRQIIPHLNALGVREIIYMPDNDTAGRASAHKLRDALIGSGIAYHARQLPPTLPDKADTNDLWQMLNFDAAAFHQHIAQAPALDLPAPQLTRARQPFTSRTPRHSLDGSLDTLSYTIAQTLNIQRYNADGWSQAIPCIFQHHENDAQRPAASWNRESHIFHCHKCGETWLAKDVAQQLGIVWERPQPTNHSRRNHQLSERPTDDPTHDAHHQFMAQIYDVPAEPFHPDITVNMPYISDLALKALPDEALLIRSAIGTGKTELVQRIIHAKAQELGYSPTVLVITHRQALAQNIAERLNIECYKDLDATWYRSAPQLVIVYNSLWKLGALGEAVPHYDLVVIDEIEQFHHHLGGNTFTGGEAKRAYDMLRQIIVSARRVIGLDAHASDISREWLANLRLRVTSIDNQYIPKRGNLTLHANSESVVRRAMMLADADEGTVVIPTSSKSEAKRLAYFFAQRYGDDDVYMICGENSEGHEAQAFIRDINRRLPELKIFIYSPSLGTGIDIQVPVRAVCGVFKGHHLAASDLHQLLGRCRNTQETHAFVQPMQGHKPDDWQMIYHKHERNAMRTGDVCEFNHNGIYTIQPIQQSMLRLLAQLEAARNRSINELLSYFIRLTYGYELCYDITEDAALRQELHQIQQMIAADERDAVLTADPVDAAEMDYHRQQGTITPEIRAGHRRWLIEETIGIDITEEHYDNLHRPQSRERLRRFTDLHTADTDLMARDKQQAADDYLLHRRSHYTLRKQLMARLIQDVWGDDWDKSTRYMLTQADIAHRMQPFLMQHLTDLVTFFNWRADQSHEPIAILRWLLKQIDLRLVSEQVMQDGQRYRVYHIDAADYDKMRRYSHLRRAYLHEQAQKDALITQNMMGYTQPRFVQHNHHPDPMPQAPANAIKPPNNAIDSPYDAHAQNAGKRPILPDLTYF